MTTLYPWLQSAWNRLASAQAQGRFPHALLLSGQPGVGKDDFSRHLAQSLLCESSDKPCSQCNACQLYLAGTHPDSSHLTFEPLKSDSEKLSKTIKIEQVRALVEKLTLSRFGDGFKVAIINPADAMTHAAANSLLKTLEEPSDNTVMVLVSSQPARLPATIRSRCQWLKLTTGDGEAGLQWLSSEIGETDARDCLGLSSGAPLAARAMATSGDLVLRREYFAGLVAILQESGNALSVAQRWLKGDEMKGLSWMYGWLADLTRLKMGGEQTTIRNVDLTNDLQKLARQVSGRKVFELMDKVAANLNRGSGSLNQQLMTEDILISWAALTEQAA